MKEYLQGLKKVIKRIIEANVSGEHYWFVKTKSLSHREETRAAKETAPNLSQMAEEIEEIRNPELVGK